MAVPPGALEEDWSVALADARLSQEESMLLVVAGDRGACDRPVLYLEPGSDVFYTEEYPLSCEQLEQANSPERRDRHRIVLCPPEDRASRVALMRFGLEFARQYGFDADIYRLGVSASDALSHVYGETGRGSASVMRLHPMWADAAAAASLLARSEAGDGLDAGQLWGPYGGILRTTWPNLGPPTLPRRLLVWAALHRDAVELEAQGCGGVAAVLEHRSPQHLAAWRMLNEDSELQRLSRAARVSIPNRARIDAAEQYPGAVWDRTLDLLDRGMTHGLKLMEH